MNLLDAVLYKPLDSVNLANQALDNTGGKIQFENFKPILQESEACLGHCQTSVMELLCKMLTAKNLISVEKIRDRFLTGSSMPLRLYFHSLFTLGIILC